MTSRDLGALSAGPPTARIAYGSSPQQFANLRLPKTLGRHPVVVFIHGGCWLSQFDIAHVGKLEQALADSGFAVWSIEYRRVGDDGGGWPNTYMDVALGADHLRRIAAQYQLDLDRVIAVYGAFKTSLTQDSHSVKRTGSLLSASHRKARCRPAY